MEYLCGLEREALRLGGEKLAKTAHPKALGDKLTHPFVTTDFAEAQVEMQTPPMKSLEEAHRFLSDVHTYCMQRMEGELFWPLSMPSVLPEVIAVADYGPSEMGQRKTAYRHELVERYGRNMQLISGVHFNYSLAGEWDKMGLCRNFLRFGYLITYLFGASPKMDPSYSEKQVGEYATSIRMSHLGYYSRIQCQSAISYDSYETYMTDLDRAVDEGLLQNHHEYYSRIRPKDDYVEVRILDVNPFEPSGVSLDDLKFLKCFLDYCHAIESPVLSEDEQCALCKKQELVALEGRDPTHGIGAEVLKLIEEMEKTLGKSFPREKAMCLDPNKTHSGRLAKEDFLTFGKAQAKKHDLSKAEIQGEIFEGLELSTLLLIKEAMSQGVDVEVLDQAHSFIKLTKGEHTEYVKQATITRLDTQITHEIMSNKEVTKHFLKEHGFPVPKGGLYTSKKIPYLQNSVIKPATANFGLGIFFPENEKQFQVAVERAFSHDDSLIVEEYLPGEEYRLLVIDYQIVAVLHRIPANVTGDGVHTVRELAHMKNDKFPEPLLTDEVLPKGKTVRLLKNSNVSTGGDGNDFTDEMPPLHQEMAVNACKALGVAICGVDMIISDLEKPGVIIEMNYNPMLSSHAYPFKGSGRAPEKSVLKLLFS